MRPAWMIIRPLNLGMVAFTFLVIRQYLLLPVSGKYGLVLSLDPAAYWLLAASVVLITAGGYVINDIRDVEADSINKPNRQWVGSSIPVSTAWMLYIILTVTGLLAGAAVCWILGRFSLLAIHIFAVVLLYLYAGFLRRQAVTGNIAVSMLIAVSVLTPAIFEPALYDLRRVGDYYAAGYVWIWVAGLSVCSFLLTFPRELIKDLEDREGDAAAGYYTFPVIAGEKATRLVVFVWLCGLLPALFWAGRYLRIEYENTIYIYYSILMSAGIVWILFLLRKKASGPVLARVSMLFKILMLLGLLIVPIHQMLLT